MYSHYWLLTALLMSAMILSVKFGKLDVAGALTGGVIGFLIYLGAGFTGIVMIGTFFILGTAATSWKIRLKQQLHLAEKEKGKRNASQVIANGGIAALTGLLIVLFPLHKAVFSVMMAASLASATADTLSSEMGNLYGRRYYNILDFREDKRGLDGVVSLEGTLFGAGGSVVIALIYALGFSWGIAVWIIIVAGVLGNIIDSILGATLQRQHFLNNDAVNLLNTLIAALIGGGGYLIFF
jgi:uncharacterized protein (TIGR00297 family)